MVEHCCGREESATVDEKPTIQPSQSTRARDHLANERTYLAWLRTAAAVMALGIAVASFPNNASASSTAAGGILVVTGAAGIVLGTRRYRQVTRELESGMYVTGTRGRVAILASTVLIISLTAAMVLLLIGRHT
jgi:putative membrane protein